MEWVEALVLTGHGPVWGTASADLNATVLSWRAGEGQPEHVNAERDVALVVLEGSGTVTVGDDTVEVAAGTLMIIPTGARRSTVAGPDGMRCVTVHRRRGGLEITRRPAAPGS